MNQSMCSSSKRSAPSASGGTATWETSGGAWPKPTDTKSDCADLGFKIGFFGNCNAANSVSLEVTAHPCGAVTQQCGIERVGAV